MEATNAAMFRIVDGGKGYALEVGPVTLEVRVAVSRDGGDPLTVEGLALSNDGRTITAQSPFGAVRLDLSGAMDGDSPALRLGASIQLPGPCRGIDLFPLFGARLDSATHILAHGRSMGRCKTCRLPAKNFKAEDGEAAGDRFESFFQTVVTFADGHLHITQPLRQPHISRVTGRIEGASITGLAVSTRFEFPSAGLLEASPTTISFVTDGFKAMCDYGDAQAEAAGIAGAAFEPPPAGWNSWDYYRWTITEDEVMRNAEFIASDPVLSKHVRRIIVDDGWQYCYGEWDANPLFPSGMEALARNLRGMGFEPGLWIAPFVVEPHSRIGQTRTEMLAMSEGGDPCLAFECMRRYGFILDPTVAETRDFLRALFDRYAGYGYRYFKIDFLMQMFKAPRLHDDSLPRGELLRTGLRPILDGIAGRAALLGCGYAYEAGCDMVRMVRAGSDIHSTWGCAKANAVSVAARAWASNRLWITDPDFCVCRGPETEDDPDRGRLKCLEVFVTPETQKRFAWGNTGWGYGFDDILAGEARCLLSVALMNGGAINLSDKLYVLNGTGLDMLRRVVSAERGSAPVPLDLFASDIASKWIQRTPSGIRALLVNWGDGEAEMEIDLAARGVSVARGRDFWTDAPVATQNGKLRATLAPHSCLLAEFPC